MTNTDETNHYAGPFCTCGDYSCPTNTDPAANCVNRDDYSAIDFHDLDQDNEDNNTSPAEIRYARGVGDWHCTYAQAQELPPLHVTDEQIAALRAALRAAGSQ